MKNFQISQTLPREIRLSGAGYKPANGIYTWNTISSRYEKDDEYQCFVDYLPMHGTWYVYGLKEDLDIYLSEIKDTPVGAYFKIRHEQTNLEPCPSVEKI